MKKILIIFFGLLLSLQIAMAQALKEVLPSEVGLNEYKLKNVDSLINAAINKNEIPGAVLAIVRKTKMAYLKAYGNKQIYPTVEAMDVNTIFDLASCTKPLATAISTMILLDRKLIRLDDNVSKFLPEFIDSSNKIKIVNLLTHTSGLPAYAPETLIKKRYGYSNPIGFMHYIDSCKRDFEPAKSMEYSCLNYIALQHVIQKISKKDLKTFAKENIFDLLQMNHTDFNPTGELLNNCAPTSKLKSGKVLLGIVHDPLARQFNCGISGNAGLFSNAIDLAILVAMLQNGGEWQGKRVLQTETVKLMRTVPDSLKCFGRTHGWDLSSRFSTCKGDSLSANTYCHTGYTGTSIVIDPDNDIAIILLTNRVHPVDKGSIVKLRSQISNIVASSIIK